MATEGQTSLMCLESTLITAAQSNTRSSSPLPLAQALNCLLVRGYRGLGWL